MYQAYLSFIVGIFVIYIIKELINNKTNYLELFKYLLCIIVGVIIYFITMKISLILFHINLASYSNANKIGISTLLNIPKKIVESYKLFYNYYFTDLITKNMYMYNNILNILFIIISLITIIINMVINKTKRTNIIICSFLLVLLPVFLNSIIFVIDDSKLQLLMASSYLTIPILILSLNHKYIKYILYFILIILMRNYLVQVQATYLTLEDTFNKYNTVINTAIVNNINELDKKFIVIGNIQNNSQVSKMNYGFISDEGLLWDEYNLRKLGFERFCLEYYGLKLDFGSEDDYSKYKDENNDEIIYKDEDLIIINFNNYKNKSN
jgi:hypothetical protein